MRPAAALALAALVALPFPRPARGASLLPSAEELLDRLLLEPDASYEGRVLVTQWFGKRARSEELVVRHRAPRLLRREYLSPDGAVERVAVSDGETERILDPRSGRVVSGDAVGSYEKSLPPERERELLLANYELTVATGEAVASRPIWMLAFKPRAVGKPWQTLSLDRQTGVLLGVKRYLPGRRLAAASRFIHFDPAQTPDEALFVLPDSSAPVAAPGLSPDFMSHEQLDLVPGAKGRFPTSLPGGFAFESGDSFLVKGHAVRHARYTDGVAAVSLFHADRPFKLPPGGTVAVPALAGALGVTRAGRVFQWKGASGHYLLLGDVSRSLLERMSSGLR